MSFVVFVFGYILLFLVVCISLFVILKYIKLSVKYDKLTKYLYNYLNVVTSARYGNLNSKCIDGIDALTIQLSRNTNALLESIIDRDMMINEYIEREKQSQNLKKDFISSLAHDLKVPIIAQDNTYDLFLQGNFGEISKIQKDAIKNLKISNNDLKNLVVDLLDAHKFEDSEIKLHLENIDVVKLVKEVIIQNKSILDIRSKEIRFLLNTEELSCTLDAFLIKRVLNNLISNAIFYGKNSKYIDIELKKIDNAVHISVIDYGDGINEDEIKNIFRKYYTSAKKYANIGAGLGLYIANKIILRHNGKLSVQNVQDKGAKFTVELPLGVMVESI